MIYKSGDNQTICIVDFGHGDLSIGLTCEEGSKINDRYVIMPSPTKPVGEYNPGKEINNAVIFTFTGANALKSIDMLIKDLRLVRDSIKWRDEVNG